MEIFGQLLRFYANLHLQFGSPLENFEGSVLKEGFFFCFVLFSVDELNCWTLADICSGLLNTNNSQFVYIKIEVTILLHNMEH